MSALGDSLGGRGKLRHVRQYSSKGEPVSSSRPLTTHCPERAKARYRAIPLVDDAPESPELVELPTSG